MGLGEACEEQQRVAAFPPFSFRMWREAGFYRIYRFIRQTNL
jgi:hypothetical protein